MANQEHVQIIRQGVEVWNKWREEQLFVVPDLSTPFLASPGIGKMSEPDTETAKAGLSRLNLSGVNFGGANLSGTNFNRANLNGANLVGAKMNYTDLIEAELMKAQMGGADFTSADLRGADFSEAIIGGTIFADVDLSNVRGLDTVTYWGGPSTIGIDTILRSQGKISEFFLRNAGVPDTIIEAIPSLIGSLRPINYYTCFISYSSKDEDFVKRLHTDLLSIGVRCWYAPEDMKIGDKIRARIDESIRLYDKLMVILSQHSIDSSCVEFEVKKALQKEQELGKLVLFPIKLDETVMETPEAWAADIRKKRHIGDFNKWEEQDTYQKAFTRLLRDLKAEPRRL